MKILKEPTLDDGEFGRAAARVSDLLKWIEESGAALVPTYPNVRDFDAVQLECLLVALHRGLKPTEAGNEGMSDRAVLETARSLIESGEAEGMHPKIRTMIIEQGDAHFARHELGGLIATHWRDRLRAGMGAGELRTFDYMTGRPLEPTALPPAPPAAETSSRIHSTKNKQRDEVDVIIDAALKAAGPGADDADVWIALQRLADSEAPPGTAVGMVNAGEKKGVKYTSNGKSEILTRNAFTQRMKRRRKAP
jgi:hypothetical protein